jgi:large subunit ribosomal protein L24
MTSSKMRLKKDDKVKVVTGKDKGKIGKVIKIDRDHGRVLVENINIIKRHSRPSAQNRQGGIIEREAFVHISNVMLMCSKCMEPVRVGAKVLEDGKKVRVCKRCSEILDA